jgi:PKD repeat protein/pimeloyl-ACP methyl ester carboxylesterase
MSISNFKPVIGLSRWLLSALCLWAGSGVAWAQGSDAGIVSQEHLAAAVAPRTLLGTTGVAPTCKDAGGKVLIDFEGCTTLADVGNGYADCGVTFPTGALAVTSARDGGTGNFTNEPSRNTILFFLNGSAARMNVPNGFVGGFSFYYCAPANPGFIRVYSGVNGTGTLLATLDLALTPRTGTTGYTYDHWVSQGVVFTGIARSVDFGGTANNIGFDNITIGSSVAANAIVSTFLFDTIGGQTINTAFPLRIRAVDSTGATVPSYNGSADLTLSPRGGLSLRNVTFVAGVATATVTCSTPTLGSGDVAAVGSGLQVRATAGTVSGSSNLFQVVDPTSKLAGEVAVTIQVPSGLSGSLTAYCDPGTTGAQQTGWSVMGPATLVARFGALGTGNHSVTAKLVSSSGKTFNSENSVINIQPGQVLSRSLHFSGKRPVLLIPGIMGSTTKVGSAPIQFDRIFPFLPWPKPLDRNSLEVYSFSGQTGFHDLKTALDPYFDVRLTPWDWRVTMAEAADTYLKPVIDEMKAVSGYDKVDIVAHSMGGLVTRAYLQSHWAANKDVDRFIMLGTPNAGSANPYWIIYGGDPEAIDHITGGLLGAVLPDTYQDVTESEMSAHPDYAYVISRDTTLGITHKMIQEFYSNNVPSIRELMAGGLTGSNAWKLLSNNSSPFEVTSNDSLVALNKTLSTVGGANCYAKLSTSPTAAVGTKLYLSNSERTIEQIPVGNPGSNGFYPQGVPLADSLDGMQVPKAGNGDGTVPAKEAAQPWGNPAIIDIVQGNFGVHKSMMLDYNLITNVMVDLMTGRTDLPAAVAQPAPRLQSTATGFAFGLIVVGRALPSIKDPSGRLSGWSGTATVDNIPSASTYFGPSLATFSTSAGANGSYLLSLAGKEQEVLTVRAQFLDAANGAQRPFLRILMRPGSYQLPFTVDGAAVSNRVVFAPALAPVSGLACQPSVNAKIQFSWSYSGVCQGFNLYSRAQSDNNYTLAQTIPASSRTFELNKLWSSGTYNFILLALAADGTESPFTNEVRNVVDLISVPVADKRTGMAPLSVNFSSQSLGSPASVTWAFGDAKTSNQPSVTHVFAAPGSYRVDLTVTSGAVSDTRSLFIAVAPSPSGGRDFDGNGRGDILWRNSVTGQVYLMPMDGTSALAGAVIWTEPNPAWQILGTGDFDGDGKSDILWRNTTTGQLFLMLMNGTQVKSSGVIYTEPNLAWSVQAIADFDGDGKVDLLWRNTTTGQVYVMPMNGSAALAGAMVWTETNPAWQIVGTGDFDGDGKADILWRNSTTGQVFQMLMDGTAVKSSSMLYTEPNLAWTIQGIADFDGDGKADLLWRNATTGQVYVMPIQGAKVLPGANIWTEPNPAWQIVATNDFDGDGKADILWRNSVTGQLYQMLMNGAAVKSSAPIYSEPNTAWTVLGTGGNFGK